ncbi:MAG TPA: glutamine amidotransferase [Bryobacteraceae bacterium]|nr:glutamine amidotransferase [Bryobacteraceae bacterium]
MFEFLFKYPATVFSKGKFVFAGSWPGWALAAAIAVAGAAIALLIWRRRRALDQPLRAVAIWALQTAMIAVLLLMLWEPALSISALKPQQNIVAVVVDDSRSMALAESDGTRRDEAVRALQGGLLQSLRERFQVRLYRLGDAVDRIERPEQLTATANATRIGEGLKQIVAESSSLPVGAIVLLSDGADNSGGIDLETISELRRHQIPVHTVGFGREQFAHDVELSDMQAPAKALAESRVLAVVTVRQHGYSGQRARLVLRDGGKALASQEITFHRDGTQTESVLFNSGEAGVRNLEAVLEPLSNEENLRNNRLVRVMNVDPRRPRILYVEGEPRWEYKFIHRAIAYEDPSMRMVTILRTTQNKIYRQGADTPDELKEGFPTRVEELFAFDGLILGSVEANWFTEAQQELIKEFVDRRGGGVLFLGGRFGLADGGYKQPPFDEILPVTLPSSKMTYHAQTPAYVELTGAGRDSLICRLDDDPDANVQRWKKLPYLMNYQEAGTPKRGALVLAEALPSSKGRLPLLIIQNYGRGRTAVFATGGSWRWQMQMPLGDKSHEMFWQQLLRWLVTGTPGHVVASTPKSLLADDKRVRLRAEVRDKTYLPSGDAQVEAHILGPNNLSATVELHPDPSEAGVFTADWSAEQEGSYLAEIVARRGEEEIGRDVLTFRREDGVAENFHAEQNRELLEKLAEQTGGRYWRPDQAKKLGAEISYSEAGITVREMRELWNMPILFFALLLIRSSEWLLRRKWGVI